MGEKGRTFEVGNLEHIGSSFTSCTDNLRSVNLYKTFLGQGIPEQLTHTSLQPEDGLVGGGPQVQHPVVQPGVLVHPGKVSLVLVCELPCSILYLQRQLRVTSRYYPHLLHVQLHILLSTALNLLINFLHHSLNINNAFFGDVSYEFDHLLTDGLIDKGQALHSDLLLPDNKETLLAFSSASMQPASDGHSLLVHLHSQVLHQGQDSVWLLLGLIHLLHPILATRYVRAIICNLSLVFSFCRLMGCLLIGFLSFFLLLFSFEFLISRHLQVSQLRVSSSSLFSVQQVSSQIL